MRNLPLVFAYAGLVMLIGAALRQHLAEYNIPEDASTISIAFFLASITFSVLERRRA